MLTVARFSFQRIARAAGLVSILFCLFAFLHGRAWAGSIVTVSETGNYTSAAPFSETSAQYPVPAGIPDSWFPLSKVAGQFGLEYSVANNMLTVTNTQAKASGSAVYQRQYLLDGRWSASVLTANGAVYVSPQILLSNASGRNFTLDSRVLCRFTEAGKGSYVAGDADFCGAVNSALYALWKQTPADYSFVIKTLSSIRQGTETNASVSHANAYVYPGSPVCTVLKCPGSMLKLSSILAHEARHVTYYTEWQAGGCQGDYYTLSEQTARTYGDLVYQKLTAVK